MKNNNNSKSNLSWANIVVFIFSLVGISLIINWISEKVSTWIVNLIFPEEARKKAAIKAAEPVLKQAIKNVKPIKFSDLEKTMGSLNKVVKEVIDENQVPENIREKIEKVTVKKISEEELPEDIKEAVKASKTKTFVNGKVYDNRDQLIYELRKLKRSKIGSHRASKLAKEIKIKMNKMLEDAKNKSAFSRLDAISLTDNFIHELNSYIGFFEVNTAEIDFSERGKIVNKYFPRKV